MNDAAIFCAVVSMSSALILIIYSGHASSRGMSQGAWFAGGQATVAGFFCLFALSILIIIKFGVLDFLIVGGISLFLGSPIQLALLGPSAGAMSILGFPVGLIMMLVFS